MTAEPASQPTDSEVILPDTQSVTIQGIEAEVRRLRTREFLALMKVLLRGVGGDLIDIFGEEDQEKLQGRLVGAMLVAIPNATNEFVMFLQAVVVAKDQKQRKQLMDYLENPELSDLLDVARVIIEQEVDEFARLGKEARVWWETMRMTLKNRGG
jgi:hypothetical protein